MARGPSKDAKRSASLNVAAAHMIVLGLLPSVSLVAITQRISRVILLFRNRPPTSQVNAFIQFSEQHDGAERETQQYGRIRCPAWSRDMVDPDIVLEFLDASSFMKDVRKTQDVGKIFARILEKHASLERGDAVALMGGLNGETLRLARVRLDIVCMMLWRRLCLASLQAHSVERTHVFLFADASPQHGAEAFCSSCDLLAGDRIERRMLPVVSLSRSMLGATGKSIALMWQMWLAMSGPSMATFSTFCERVRSITTDLGVERKMVDCPNITEEFFALVNRRAFGDIANAGFLFPRAVCVPGWKHMVDNLLRSGLNTLRWLPSWLAGLKATVGFVRSPMNKEAIVKHWRRRGLVGLAETFSDTQIVGFADWRWNTLCIVCRGLTSILNGLVGHFDPTIFANGRNPAELSRMLAAIRSES